MERGLRGVGKGGGVKEGLVSYLITDLSVDKLLTHVFGLQ